MQIRWLHGKTRSKAKPWKSKVLGPRPLKRQRTPEEIEARRQRRLERRQAEIASGKRRAPGQPPTMPPWYTGKLVRRQVSAGDAMPTAKTTSRAVLTSRSRSRPIASKTGRPTNGRTVYRKPPRRLGDVNPRRVGSYPICGRCGRPQLPKFSKLSRCEGHGLPYQPARQPNERQKDKKVGHSALRRAPQTVRKVRVTHEQKSAAELRLAEKLAMKPESPASTLGDASWYRWARSNDANSWQGPT